MRVLISITDADIRAGERHSCRRCPIALAAARALPTYRVVVRRNDLHLSKLNRFGLVYECHIIGLPSEPRRFIRDFDGDNDVKPMSFEIEVSDGAK